MGVGDVSLRSWIDQAEYSDFPAKWQEDRVAAGCR